MFDKRLLGVRYLSFFTVGGIRFRRGRLRIYFCFIFAGFLDLETVFFFSVSGWEIEV